MKPSSDLGSTPPGSSSIGSERIWFAALIACAIAIGAQAGFSSLSDPDLPSHLAMGQWIVEHGRVPRTEPVAWTRAGAPYYAYSWLPQVFFYTVMAHAGPLGLHVLASVIAGVITLAAAATARSMGATPAAATTYAVASALIALSATPFLRPQLVMFALVPISWMGVARTRRATDGNYAWLVVIFIANALAAATHISFPVMASSFALLVREPRQLRSARTWQIVGATVLGWFASPYAGSWVQVFRLNFAPNALTRPPALSGEMTPGFLVAPLIGALLSALPILAVPRIKATGERVVFGVMWLAGLVTFARVFKGLGPWWWCSIPYCVSALEWLPPASSPATRRVFAGLLVAFVAALGIVNARLYSTLSRLEGDANRRTLPSMRGYAAEPALRWLEQNTRTGSRGRLLTTFNYGSYAEWRLPTLSPSIDGRTIFPDSAALPDAIGEQGPPRDGPWRSADVAIVPETYPAATQLSGDPQWVSVGYAERAPWGPSAPRAGLWLRRSWWTTMRAADAVLPSAPVELRATP